MSYKNFEAFNKALSDLAPTARSNLIFRLINLSSQLASIVEDLPGNWARAYASVQQLQYDADGRLEDVTSTEAISSVDNLIYAVRSKFLSVKNDLDSLAKQIDSVPIQVTITHIDARFNINKAFIAGNYYFQYVDYSGTSVGISFSVDSNGHFHNFQEVVGPSPSGYTVITPSNAGDHGLYLQVHSNPDNDSALCTLASLNSNNELNICMVLNNLKYMQSDGTTNVAALGNLPSTTGDKLNVSIQSKEIQVPVTLRSTDILSYDDGSTMLGVLNNLVS